MPEKLRPDDYRILSKTARQKNLSTIDSTFATLVRSQGVSWLAVPTIVMDARSPSESDVADRSQDERLAWEEMIRVHGPRVLAHLVARGVRIDRAKEIANDAWAKLFEGRRDGRFAEMKMPGLILQQATYLAIDAARRGRWEVAADILPDVADRAPSIEDVLTSKEDLSRARKAFEQSSAAEQRIFLALYEQPERSGRDIAAMLGVSEQRVKQVAYEVRKRIRAALHGDRAGTA